MFSHVGRYAGKMHESTREHIKMAQENARLSARLRGNQQRLADAEARAARYKEAAENEERRASIYDLNSASLSPVIALSTNCILLWLAAY